MGGGRLDDPAPFLFLHIGHGEARRVEGGVEVERDDEVPFVERELLDRGDMLHARIVDKNVHPAKGVRGLLHHRLDLVDLGEIMARIERLCPGQVFQTLPFPLYRICVAEAVDDDVRAFASQRLGISKADAGGRSGDQGRLASEELAHAVFSLR